MEPIKEIKILGNSFVQYVHHLGGDKDIVAAARVSYGDTSKGDVADKKLLRYLFKNKHTSPFEMVNITFIIRMPIFVQRQLVRHRTFRLNEISARYVELDKGSYIPGKWRVQDPKNKQGSVYGDFDVPEERFTEVTEHVYKVAMKAYRYMLDHGVAKELARMVLPVGFLTEIRVNIDLSNLIKFFSLRDDPHAQWEHQQIAYAMKTIAKQHYPWTLEMYEELSNA